VNIKQRRGGGKEEGRDGGGSRRRWRAQVGQTPDESFDGKWKRKKKILFKIALQRGGGRLGPSSKSLKKGVNEEYILQGIAGVDVAKKARGEEEIPAQENNPHERFQGFQEAGGSKKEKKDVRQKGPVGWVGGSI